MSSDKRPLFPDRFEGWPDFKIPHGRDWELKLEAIAKNITVTPEMILAGRLALVSLLREPCAPTNEMVEGIYRAMRAAHEASS